MKIARFSHGETIAFGIVDAEEHELVVLKSDPMFAGYDPTGERSWVRRWWATTAIGAG